MEYSTSRQKPTIILGSFDNRIAYGKLNRPAVGGIQLWVTADGF